MKKNVLEIKELKVTLSQKVVLDIDHLEIPREVLLAVVGPNGAGKTTLINCILNRIIYKADSLKIFNNSYALVKKRIVYVPQRDQLDWEFPINVFDFVLTGCYGHLGWIRRPRKEDKIMTYKALEKLDLIGLEKRQIGELSGGQKQRIFLARALVQDGDLFILDEPFQGIDTQTEKKIIFLLKELRKEKKTAIIVHHDLSKIKEYFNWTLLLNVKKISLGPTYKIFNQSNLIKTYSY